MQDTERLLPAAWQFIRKILIATAGGLLLAGLYCLISGNRTGAIYGEACVWAGQLCFIVGVGSLIGSFGLTRGFLYQQSESTSMSVRERLGQRARDFTDSFGFLFLMLFAGGLLMLLGSLIEGFFSAAP